MWRSTAGPVAGRVAGLEAEPEAPVVQEDPEVRQGHVAAEAVGVRLDERHRHAVAVDHALVHRVAVVPGISEHGSPVGIDGVPSGAEPFRGEQGGSVGVLVQHPGPVMSGLSHRLDEEVYAQRVVLPGQVEAFGDQGRCQRQVPLRIWWHRPDVVAPHPGTEGLDPVGLWAAQVVVAELAGTDGEQFVAVRAQVHGIAAALCQGP